MYCYNKLRGRIVERFGTMLKFAEALGESNSAVSAKFKSKNGFSQAVIVKWSELLEIAPEDYAEYFFS